MSKPTDITPFQKAAGRVRNRIGQIAFARWLRASHWIVGIAGLAAVFVLRYFFEWRTGELWIVAGLFLAWIAIGFIYSIFSRPESLGALSVFDRKGGWNDQFSSAFFFLSDGPKNSPALTDGQLLHIDRANRALPEAVRELPRKLPLPALGVVWILPLLAFLFAASPIARKTLSPGDAILSEEMMKTAGAEADQIRKAARDLDGLKALNEDEKEELKMLGSSIDEAAEELANSEGQTAKGVLSALEARARAAERLAERLGLTTGDWASEEFIRELSQHADTADLAIGIKDKNSGLVADQSDLIAETLGNDDIQPETEDRFTIALERSVAKATEEDRTRPVGERIGNASEKLTARQPKTAAREFEELAKHFRRVLQREEAQAKLQKLAAQLRNSGSQISGSKLESLKSLDDITKKIPEGLKSIEATPMAQQLQNLMAPQIPQPGPGGGSMPIPGSLGNSPDGQGQSGNGNEGGQEEGVMAPVPGEGSGGKDGQGFAMQPSDKQPENGENGGILNAPVPGSSPGSGSPGSNLGSGAGNGSGGQGAGGAGGNEAGSATMDMFAQKDNISKADQEAGVAAQISDDGDSEFRTVDGSSNRVEKSSLSRKEIMTNFIDVEEEALDEQTLPLTRRRQVLRYFSEIRRQLEEESK